MIHPTARDVWRTKERNPRWVLSYAPKWKALAVFAVMCVAITHSVAEGKNKEQVTVVKPNLTPLMLAAMSCDEKGVTALLSQGADVKAVDARGNDALTFASVQRTKDMLLQCPNVVLALTKAGADPWKANFYQSPEFNLHQPSKIAVIYVADIRGEKDDRTKGFTEGVEQALTQGMPRYTPVITPHYPIMKLSEVREKLKAGGFTDAEALHPDRKRACSVLGVDAVFEAVVKGYAHGFFVDNEPIVGPSVGINNEVNPEYWLTDCGTGELLWRNNPSSVGVQRSLLAAAFTNGSTTLCEQAITFPRYKGPKN
jgi:hypothetical protein